MPKLDNILAILRMLSTSEKITAKQISEKLEINIRTVYRYIDTLSTSGVPIISYPGHNGGYTLLKEFFEAPLFFDAKEQASLFHAAVFAEEAGYYGGEVLKRAISKLGKYSNQEQEAKVNQYTTSLEVISRVNSIPLEPILQEVERAVASRFSIKIQYYKNGKNQSTYRLVDPYKIIFWNNKWYIIGFCHFREGIRSFRADRIEDLLVTENKFDCPNDFLASDSFLKNLLPTIKDEKEIVSLVIIGDTSTINDICQHWFLGNYLHEKSADQAVFLLEKDITHTYVPHLLLPYAKSIQIIEPASLKKKIIEVLLELLKVHQE